MFNTRRPLIFLAHASTSKIIALKRALCENEQLVFFKLI